MVLILDGNSEIGAHVICNLFHLICLRQFIRSRGVTNFILFSEKTIFLSVLRVLSYHLEVYYPSIYEDNTYFNEN